MSTPAKLHGVKLGKTQKDVTELMRKGDDPPGKPILIWNDIYQTYGIEFSAYPKKDQPEELNKENKYKCAISRLTKIGVMKYEIIASTTSKENLPTPNPRGHGYNYYSLTKYGRLIADKLHQQQLQKERSLRAKEDLKKTMDQLRDAGYVEVTIDQIQNVLWQLTGNSFSNRAEFDGYWNIVRIGIMLHNCKVERTRISKKNRQQKYHLI